MVLENNNCGAHGAARETCDAAEHLSDGNTAKSPDLPLRCPCCHCKTLSERAAFEICPVCFWEDDGQDAHNASVVSGGPNGTLSLVQAQSNYQAYGAANRANLPHVRTPRPEER